MKIAKLGALDRRSVLAIAAAAALPISIQIGEAQATEPMEKAFGDVKAMTFDIQGTLFDYYRPFIRIGARLGAQKGLTLDWPGFLQEWNTGVGATIQAIASGKRTWIPPGQVFREALDQLLTNRGLAGQFDEHDRIELMSVWGQMVPWPDTVEGVKRLKRHFTVAALSNAGMSTLISLAKRSGLPFDAVLSGELVRAYKPTLDVYRSASTYLGFPPEQIMMVSTHKPDLKGAKQAGFKTAFIPRPLEAGPKTKFDPSPEPFIDVIAHDLVGLSTKIGVA